MHRHEAVSFDTVFLFSIFSTTMILYVFQAKISLRRQSGVGRASDRTVCHSCVGSSLICNKTQRCFFLFAILLLYFFLQKLPYRLIRFFCICFFCSNKYQSAVAAGYRARVTSYRVSHCSGGLFIYNKPQHCFFLFAILLLYFVFAETYLSLDMFFLFLLRCRNKEQFTAAGCHSAVWHRRVDNSFFTVILCDVFQQYCFRTLLFRCFIDFSQCYPYR